jgi:hypothetical protein
MAESLRHYGFEYRACDDGLTRLHHIASGTRLMEKNWRIFTGGDYAHLADGAMQYFHALCCTSVEEGGVGMRWRQLEPPANAPPGAPTGKVIETPDLETNTRALLVIIPGTGQVRAGMWGRGLLVHTSLEQGSSLGLLRHALARGWAVVCFDPNKLTSDSGETLAGSATREQHCYTAWSQRVIRASPARRVSVIAHSAGGSWLLRCLQPDCTPDPHLLRLRALAFSDSIHTMAAKRLDPVRFRLLAAHGRQWRAGPGALDEPMVDDRAPTGRPELGCGCTCVRAGTEDHASTVYSSQASVLAFVDGHMRAGPGSECSSLSDEQELEWLDAAEHAQLDWRATAKRIPEHFPLLAGCVDYVLNVCGLCFGWLGNGEPIDGARGS